jgi:hypothetical protein
MRVLSNQEGFLGAGNWGETASSSAAADISRERDFRRLNPRICSTASKISLDFVDRRRY